MSNEPGVTEKDTAMTRKKTPEGAPREAAEMLRHWHESVPNDRLAHQVKDATRSMVRALQMRLAEHSVSFGHWTFLRILWETDGLTQRELSEQAGVMAPTTSPPSPQWKSSGWWNGSSVPRTKNTHVYLTAEGRALKDKLVPLAEEVNEISVTGLSERDIRVRAKYSSRSSRIWLRTSRHQQILCDVCCRLESLAS